jgi:ATP-dependent DNA helicase RecQ
VVTIASTTRPQLVTSLGERIATVGRLPLLGEVRSAPTDGRPANSARRLAQLHRSLHLDPGLTTRLSDVDGPVLLVDDRVDTGWTMTVAAKLLRNASARAVLPFALAATS